MKVDPPAVCDVVVIGAGIGGLTAGALLAQAGMHVCVLDREVRAGGYMAGFRRKKFVFDTAIHWLNQCGPGGIVHRIFGHIGDDAPHAPPLGRIRRYLGDSFDYLLTSEPDTFRDALRRDAPRDADRIDRFFATARVLGERLRSYGRMMRGPETMSAPERLVRGLRLARWSVPFWRFVGDKDGRLLRRYFRDPRLHRLFCSEDSIMSCLVPVGWAYVGDYQRPPRGGSQVYPQWLTRRIRDAGSAVLLRTPAERIVVEQGRVVGTQLQAGPVIRCRWVIAACDIDTIFSRMLPSGSVPGDTIERYRSADLYCSCVTLSIGLDTTPQSLGFGEELTFLTSDGLPREAYGDGDPHSAALSILAPSLRDPTLAPPGKGTLTIYASAPMSFGDRWKTGPGLVRGADYDDFKRAYAEVLLNRVEEAMVPGLRSHIELLDVATPVTHHRYTGNRDGTIMGQQPTPKNFRLKVSGYRTPVDRLLVGGHWGELGGGVPMAVKAAANAAAIVLRTEGNAAFRGLREAFDRP